MTKIKDLTGQRFGRLKVQKLAPQEQWKGHNAHWVCLCACGEERTIAGCDLRRGRIKSCSCFSRERSTSHGKYGSPEYESWRQLIQRCTNEKHEHYHRYGGRGITVCQRWRDSFEAFYADMGPKPDPRHSIDRIDFNGDYAPENCRWSSQKDQCRNKCNNALVVHEGAEMCLKDAAELAGLPYDTVKWRRLNGWSNESLFLPIGSRRPGALPLPEVES